MSRRRLTLDEALKAIGHAEANLNAYGAVIGVLEAGTIRSGRAGPAHRIIAIAKKAMQNELRIYDDAVAQARLRAQGL